MGNRGTAIEGKTIKFTIGTQEQVEYWLYRCNGISKHVSDIDAVTTFALLQCRIPSFPAIGYIMQVRIRMPLTYRRKTPVQLIPDYHSFQPHQAPVLPRQ